VLSLPRSFLFLTSEVKFNGGVLVKIDANYTTLKESNLKGLDKPERGKVRDVYSGKGGLYMVTTDRISTHNKPYYDCIPHKGFGLTQTTIYAFKNTGHIAPNHLIDSPDPNVMVVEELEMYPVEVIVRGILTGSAWTSYQEDGTVCGIRLPKGMKKNQELEAPIITPTRKSKNDEPITNQQALDMVGPVWYEIADLSIKLYNWGDKQAKLRGAKLADTKLEWGRYSKDSDVPFVGDEMLDHDSSRYVMLDNWKQALREGIKPDWIDKQYVRDYAEDQGFFGDGDPPRLPEEIIRGATERVLKAYYILSGNELELPEEPPTNERIERNLKAAGYL
jgi:phosphoribosylaminoimidazole-succinocarboxamide synthase